MPKGAYKISQLPGPGPAVRVTSGKDASFGACIASLLVFFFICLIIVLATLPWRNHGSTSTHDKRTDDPNFGRVYGGPMKEVVTSTPKTTTTDLNEVAPPGLPETYTEESDVENIDPIGVASGRSHDAIVSVINSTNESFTDSSSESTPELTVSESSSIEVTVSEVTEAPTVKSTSNVPTTTEEPSTTTNNVVETSGSMQEDQTHEDMMIARSITVDTLEQQNLDKDEELCETGECKSLASRMLSLMNHTVDPCEDFYKYACGGLRHNRGLLPADPEQEVEEKIRIGMSAVMPTSPNYYRQFIHFYETCLTYQTDFTFEQRVEKARTELKQVGTLYDKDTWEDNETHFTQLLVRLFKVHSTPLFDLFLDVADTGRGTFALRLTPPLHRSVLLDIGGIGHKSSSEIPPSDCFEKTAPASPAGGHRVDLNETYDHYLECTQNWGPFIERVEEALRAFGAFDTLPELNKNIYFKDLRSLLEDILDLRKNHLPAAGLMRHQILGKEYKLLTLKQLQDEYSLLDWRILIKELLNEEVPDSTKVQVYFDSYFNELFMELSTAEMRTLNNMLLGLFAHELYAGLVVENPTCDRAKLCLKSARSLMDDVASILYLASFKPEQVNNFKTQAREIFTRTKAVLEEEMKNAKWLNADGGVTREALLTKLREMKLELGTERSAFGPERTMMQVPQDGDFFDTFLALLKRLRKRMYADYFSAPQAAQQLWSHFANPTSTSGIAIYGLNSVLLPLGVYSLPNYYEGAPNYIQMATLGSLIAHEMSHHFDNTGISFDSKGRKDKLDITEGVNTHYEEMLQLADGQYSYPRSFNVEGGGIIEMKLDSALSLNERFADQMASYIAISVYSAWQEQDKKRGVVDGHRVLPWLGMTWRQAFFLAQAQTHCANDNILDHRVALFEEEHFPPFLRVNNMVSNSKQFVEAFICVTGQNMNSGIKVPPFPALDASPESEDLDEYTGPV